MSIKITCRTPSTGKPINILLSDVPTTFTTISEAPYYSVPDASIRFPVRDPEDDSGNRALREGEIFFVTPLSARNKDTEAHEIEVRIVTEPQVLTGAFRGISKIVEFSKIVIPAGDTALIPLQGRSIFKRDIVLKIVPVEAEATLTVEKSSALLVESNSAVIINDMWQDLVDGGYVDGWTSTDEAYTRRDAASLIDCVRSVLATSVERPMLDFARGLFDETGTSYIEAGKKTAFIHSWDFINTQINDLSGMSSNATTIVSALFTALKATVNASSQTLEVTPGDVIQVKADAANVFDIWTSAEEKPSNEHAGLVV